MLGLVMDHAIDAADLYFQVSREESWALEDGIVKEGSASIEEGVGVRAISGEKTGFAYSDEIQPAALEEASRAARAIAKQSPGKGMQAWKRNDAAPLLYQPIDPLASMDDAVKIAWLERVDRETRAMDTRVKQVMASCHAVHEIVLVASSDGQARRRRASAGALQCLGDRRAGRPPRDGLCRCRRPLHAGRTGRGRSPAEAGARGRAPGAGESRSRACSGWPDAGGARARLAWHPAARGHRPRPGRGLQPQGHLGLQQPARRTRGERAHHRGRRRHAVRAPWFAEHR